MCGIAGILRFDGRPVAQGDLLTLTNALSHRGRDNTGTAWGGPQSGSLSAYPGVGLGHRRLSIIDLSPASDQPMTYGTPALWITYNGELYNFEALRQELASLGCTFRTQSDTEVVLAAYRAWGDGCLGRFNGMYAFAIWDEGTQSLFCARDPIGIKPFYYTCDREAFRFASEAQALARVGGRGLDDDAVSAYLLSMYMPGPMSILASVHKLLPGRFMRVGRDGTTTTTQYWRSPRCAGSDVPAADAAVTVRGLLDRAVAAQLRSDVPVGALLSGGFDSGMIVASAASSGTVLHTYSVGFDDGQQFDEVPIARSLAQRYGTRHHERIIRSEEVLPFLDRALACMSEPVADSAVVPTYCLSQMAAADGVKVLLSGTGGDEVFAGYPRYVGDALPRRILLAVPDGLRRIAAAALTGHAALSARLKHRGLDMLMTTGGSARLARSRFADERAFGVFLERLANEMLPAASHGFPELYQHMRFDLEVYLPDLLLMLLDQLTMAHTVEGRVPLLDIDLIAASYSLPAAAHASSTQTRTLMRRMAADRLDPRTLAAPKQGFSGPVKKWIADNRRTFQERTMAIRDIAPFSSIPVAQLWDDDAARTNPRWASEVFSLYCFSTWYQAHARA